MKGRRVAETLVVAILATIVVFVVVDLAGGIGDFPNERWAAAIAMVCLAIWIGPGALARVSAGGALKIVAIWLAIAVAIALIFVYGKDYLVAAGVNL